MLIIPAAFIIWFFNQSAQDKPIRYLPYYGPKYADKLNDTSYHTITNFKFIDQYNEEVNETTFKNVIYVASLRCGVHTFLLKNWSFLFLNILQLINKCDTITKKINLLELIIPQHGFNFNIYNQHQFLTYNNGTHIQYDPDKSRGNKAGFRMRPV